MDKSNNHTQAPPRRRPQLVAPLAPIGTIVGQFVLFVTRRDLLAPSPDKSDTIGVYRKSQTSPIDDLHTATCSDDKS